MVIFASNMAENTHLLLRVLIKMSNTPLKILHNSPERSYRGCFDSNDELLWNFKTWKSVLWCQHVTMESVWNPRSCPYLGLQCSVIYWAPTEMYFEIKLWIHRTGEDVNVSFFHTIHLANTWKLKRLTRNTNLFLNCMCKG